MLSPPLSLFLGGFALGTENNDAERRKRNNDDNVERSRRRETETGRKRRRNLSENTLREAPLKNKAYCCMQLTRFCRLRFVSPQYQPTSDSIFFPLVFARLLSTFLFGIEAINFYVRIVCIVCICFVSMSLFPFFMALKPVVAFEQSRQQIYWTFGFPY